jgi:methylthioxylose transferase
MRYPVRNLDCMAEARAEFARSNAHSLFKFLGERSAAATAAWAALIATSAVLGARLLARPEPDMDLDAPPLFGRFEFDPTPRLLVPAVVAVVVIASFQRWSAWPWRRLLGVVFGGGVVWAVSLAASDGFAAITAPLTHPADYLAAVPVDSPSSFMRDLVTVGDALPLHVRAHPPGTVLLLSLLHAVGLATPGWTAALAVCGGASAGAAALIVVRSIAGERRARSAAPFVILAPAAIWIATSVDALFLGVSAWAVAALVVAGCRRDRAADVIAFGGGLLFGSALFLSYGVAVLAVVPVVVGVARRSFRHLLVGAAGAATVAAFFAAGGFWWWEGLAATLDVYRDGISRYRPTDYFLIANLAALGVALGPAVAAGLVSIARKGLLLPTGAALVAVLIADVSGLSKGEVERIWLPFVPWLLVAAGTRDEQWMPWCCAQAGWTILVQASIQTPW